MLTLRPDPSFHTPAWYFLPWHRVYLYFERIVGEAVTELGGPADCALPYWNYSDGQRPQVRQLPPAFRAQTLPDGSPNALFVSERGSAMNTAGQLGASTGSTNSGARAGPAHPERLSALEFVEQVFCVRMERVDLDSGGRLRRRSTSSARMNVGARPLSPTLENARRKVYGFPAPGPATMSRLTAGESTIAFTASVRAFF